MPPSDAGTPEAPAEELGLVTAPTDDGEARQRRLDTVRRSTKTWTGQLVDLTGRNNLLYYRDLKVGTLPLDECQRQTIYNALAGKAILLSRLFPGEEECADAIKRARSVRNKANA